MEQFLGGLFLLETNVNIRRLVNSGFVNGRRINDRVFQKNVWNFLKSIIERLPTNQLHAQNADIELKPASIPYLNHFQVYAPFETYRSSRHNIHILRVN